MMRRLAMWNLRWERWFAGITTQEYLDRFRDELYEVISMPAETRQMWVLLYR